MRKEDAIWILQAIRNRDARTDAERDALNMALRTLEKSNSGWYNSGNYNSGDYNSGFFNTNSPTVRLFNSDSGMSLEQFFRLGIDFGNLESSKEKIKSLPNYDSQIFYESTGIDWREELEE